ncbi:hypothetical protein ElyMa_000897400 [Elysia marginata]|uniref:Uncharacterized protein n=1 Tax=Elysia marginata TaxID=1093978 RepID=A0AAV4H778_9GAST|nr:hypothetical protein ElyMa_000897400 [Elysia marginata]
MILHAQIQGRQNTEHFLSSCKVVFSQGRPIGVLQEHESAIRIFKGQTNPLSASFTIFTTEGSAKKWHETFTTTSTQRRGLLNGCDDWVVLSRPLRVG